MQTIAVILVATAWGSMLFFAMVIAPSVFRFLKPDVAGLFIRRLFPIYYLMLGAVCALASIAQAFVLPQGILEFILLLLVMLGFIVARQAMMPRINKFRDSAKTGDRSASAAFQRWHRGSVVLNSVQMLVILYVLSRLAW